MQTMDKTSKKSHKAIVEYCHKPLQLKESKCHSSGEFNWSKYFWFKQNALTTVGVSLSVPLRICGQCFGSLTTDLRTVVWSCTSTPPRCRYSDWEPCPLAPRTSSFMYTTSLWLDMYVPQSTENFSLTAWLPGLPFLRPVAAITFLHFDASRDHTFGTTVTVMATTRTEREKW